MVTIRELFHNLGNKHNLITVGIGTTSEIVENSLKENDLKVIKENLSEIINNLDQIVEGALEADKITTEIHDRIYKVMDPDTGKPK
jgi:hypothetical protein